MPRATSVLVGEAEQRPVTDVAARAQRQQNGRRDDEECRKAQRGSAGPQPPNLMEGKRKEQGGQQDDHHVNGYVSANAEPDAKKQSGRSRDEQHICRAHRPAHHQRRQKQRAQKKWRLRVVANVRQNRKLERRECGGQCHARRPQAPHRETARQVDADHGGPIQDRRQHGDRLPRRAEDREHRGQEQQQILGRALKAVEIRRRHRRRDLGARDPLASIV